MKNPMKNPMLQNLRLRLRPTPTHECVILTKLRRFECGARTTGHLECVKSVQLRTL